MTRTSWRPPAGTSSIGGLATTSCVPARSSLPDACDHLYARTCACSAWSPVLVSHRACAGPEAASSRLVGATCRPLADAWEAAARRQARATPRVSDGEHIGGAWLST